jgi:hypothetical protein
MIVRLSQQAFKRERRAVAGLVLWASLYEKEFDFLIYDQLDQRYFVKSFGQNSSPMRLRL